MTLGPLSGLNGLMDILNMVWFPQLLSGSRNRISGLRVQKTFSVFVPVHICQDREVSGLMSSTLRRPHRIGLYDIWCTGFYLLYMDTSIRLLTINYSAWLFGWNGPIFLQHYVCVCFFNYKVQNVNSQPPYQSFLSLKRSLTWEVTLLM